MSKLEEKQKRVGNGFAAAFREFDHRLRTEGYPVTELHRNGRRLLAPGITVKQYIDTLVTIQRVAEVDGVMLYRPPQLTIGLTEDEIAFIIQDEFLKGESAQWHRVAARRMLNELAARAVGGK